MIVAQQPPLFGTDGFNHVRQPDGSITIEAAEGLCDHNHTTQDSDGVRFSESDGRNRQPPRASKGRSLAAGSVRPT